MEHFAKGAIPTSLDIPTGLGKTAVMAIWAAALAAGAKLPRRLVYVVDRRAVVDQATEEAERIKRVVDETDGLRRALGITRPLPISTLRGQHVDNREWLEDPSSPAIVVGTVDMLGSRLLFEGYRCSRKMRPYHAALLGADALIVLDEAHLVPAFEAMVRAATQDQSLMADRSVREVVPPSRVMSLSATGRGAGVGFQLDEADRRHEVLVRRLDAKKRVRISAAVESSALAAALASKAWEVSAHGMQASRVIVFVDSRKTAQEVQEAIGKLADGEGESSRVEVETELFVGGRRVAEREAAAKRLGELGMIAGSTAARQGPVFVIATSAGEVGVDLDADHAVLDLVEWERMVQRLGRVNRRGDGEADVWIVPSLLDDKTEEALAKDEALHNRQRQDEGDLDDSDDADDDTAEGDDDGGSESAAKAPKRLKDDERSRVDRWRRRQATQRALQSLSFSDGTYDASPRALSECKKDDVKAGLIKEGSTPAPLHPRLSRAVVESWSMTSLAENPGRPPVRPWLRGWVEEDAQTTVVWRRWLPRRADVGEFFEAAPIETAEILEMESVLVMDWLAKRVRQVRPSRQLPTGAKPDDPTPIDEPSAGSRPPLELGDTVLFVLGDRNRGYTLGELDGLDKRGRDLLFRDLAGATIVVDLRIGGLGDGGLLDPKTDDATDVSEMLRLPFRVREVESLEELAKDGGWRVEETFVSRTDGDGEAAAWLVVETDPMQQSTTADGRSTGREQRLDEHEMCAERHARAIAERAGLKPEHVEMLALAAVLHDEGKKAERWQRAFRAPPDKRPLGKTTSRPIQSILAGYRHELGSLPYAERDGRVAVLASEDRDLVLHLIAAHHGFARPILRTEGCDDAPPSALVERARAIALRFARLEKLWGPWGLAWWEALLRAADQTASRENDERGVERG
ncbi:MAG: type I-U CRISPR-associated helicase/endonuclease Cas3 [Deltaproteobacteria bacterium]|nr:type I-U CRISPR-associated helicase/endonuclease Cas3 [Deltaproteobacteria bacterium]